MAKVSRDLRRRRSNPDGRMAVMDHMRELRRRMIWMVLFIGLGAVLGWVLYAPILEFLKHPYCSVPQKYRYTPAGAGADKCVLSYYGVLDGFTARLKISVVTGAVLTAPLWLYQIWAFITPGLRKKERRYTISFVIASTLLFVAGMSLAYLVLSKGLYILLRTATAQTQANLTITAYLSFVTLMLVVFGAAFELPLLIVMANLAGVLSGKILKKSQRVGVFLIFLFAAVATPSTDPFTMCAMAVPMVILFELSVLFAVVHDRRKARRKAEEAAEPHLEDDVASSIDPIPDTWRTPERVPGGGRDDSGSAGSDDGWSDVT